MAPAAGRRVTAVDVARAAGVSRATVGFVLNNTRGQTISESTRARVLETALRLGYRPNSAAKALVSGRSRIILLVLPDWPLEFLLRNWLDEASRVLDESGYSLVTYARRPNGATRPLWESLNPDIVFGLVPFSDDDLVSMRGCGIRRIYPDPARWDNTELRMAVRTGPELQVAHLRDRGFTKLVYAALEEPSPYSLVEARHRAACDHADSLGLPPPDLRLIDYRDGSAERVVHDWYTAGVTGVVAFNDDVAATVVSAALRAGMRVPADLGVIGHDDSLISATFAPALSTIRFDTAALGRGFAHFALHEVEGYPLQQWQAPENAVELVHRETT
ncbi:LacI family DNA-binding transcriptional regulator [Frankia sp. CNm7]|uniref:LacI family DNA-binding transcriptional regulator n=1 Tax=Frankia nepalensis TaxID=1836974 RepID=A0A937RC78_9ACTN|nr:LacI family DNA-binding transcriptional regulator [Frankia nepalensis]MBL7508460.1 LacI family DNA-binding transcriptional regulator [Frankia nepalensis]MBL7521624.1 LacI family DNA-binding transcriptional regulator [Frankia nepalensis]MBL7627592.1 LacI family DNA-binding transcriptional regulator [Frankia nepalensis]